MKNKIVLIFIIITTISLLAGCGNKGGNKAPIVNGNLNTPDISGGNTTSGGNDISSENNLTDEQIEMLEQVIPGFWNRTDAHQEFLSKDIANNDLFNWFYSYLLDSFFNKLPGISYEQIEHSLVVTNSDVNKITTGLLGVAVDEKKITESNYGEYYDKESKKWHFPIASGEPKPSAVICNIKNVQGKQLIITGYVYRGSCMEFTGTYDPLYRFVAEGVINPESNFGCTIEKITFGNENYIRSIEASSELTDSSGTYYIKNILDNNYKTAWVPENTNGSVGQYVTINLDKNQELYGFAIANGYFKSLESYENNGKVKRIKLIFDDE
ncbi:MAG: discoidin domain-containing protein [Clostridium sp.]|mgnify:CR=1 FL=1|nr:discoidin domain-containing protein [Clostridium sp.]